MISPHFNKNLNQSIVIYVAMVFCSFLIPLLTWDIIDRRKNIELSAKDQATAALDMLEAVHVQAMLNRAQTPDGDPAIATLNGTMEQFSQDSKGVRLWVFMGPKVVDFQKSRGESELEGPMDDLDRSVARSRAVEQALDGDHLRLSRPVVLGVGHAANPRCAECHGGLMGILPGELVGGYSASVDMTAAYTAWRQGIVRSIGSALGLFMAVIVAIYCLLRSVALKPLHRLSSVTRKLAGGDTNVDMDFGSRDDAIGSMADSLQTFRDRLIAERHLEASHAAAHRELEYLALHDPLTGLPNRAYFHDRLRKALRGPATVAVLALDLDHFKEVNDTLGHGAGDQLLVSVAEQLRRAVGEAGFVGRLGGDEFVLVLADVKDPAQAEALCQSILALFASRRELDGQMFSVTMSIGVAMAGVDGSSADDLLRHADIALSDVKTGGRNGFRFFSTEMNTVLTERRELERELRDAIERKALELHYQPIIDIKSGRITSVEALMRWNHGTKGWIAPSIFIPVAEASGLIIPLGRWLLETACRQAAAWSSVTLAVNMSPAQFHDQDLVSFVRETLRDTGLEPGRLDIEITEGLLLEEKYRPLEVLTSLKALGTRISMDDFGTGYSSLGYLQSFPFDKIKIDRSFIRNIENDINARAIVRSVINLGQNLGMATTAEGVETAEQLDFLRREGCEQVQGYHLARPQPPQALTSLLARWICVRADEPLRADESDGRGVRAA